MPLIRGSKNPFIEDWVSLTPDPTQGPEAFPDNYGVVLNGTTLVIDVDPKNFADGDDSWLRLKSDLGLTDADLDTYTVRSRLYGNGREGLHMYFSKPDGVNTRMLKKEYKGIEIKTLGHFLVGPGSIHPDTGKPYIVLKGKPTELKEVPIQILTTYAREQMAHGTGTGGFTDDEPTRKRFIEYLASAPLAVQGQGGDKQTYDVACVGRDYNLPEEATFDLMWACWNDRCTPPWTDKDLRKKVANAYLYANDAPGNMHPAADFNKIEVPQTANEVNRELQRKLDRRKADQMANIHWHVKGFYDPNQTLDEPQLRPTILNVINFFQRPHYGEFRSDFYRMVRHNDFSLDIEFTRAAPWHSDIPPRCWSDNETIMLRTWFARVRDWHPPKELVLDGVIAASQLYRYHPVVEYFKNLKWDGVPRLDKLLPYYAGAEDNIYTREAGRRTMIAAVARILKPGCKHDHVLILEGPQGSGKSTFCNILGGKHYADLHIEPKDKDTVVGLLGKHIIELSELTYNRKSDVESMKKFFSQLEDRVRLPYGKMAVDLPRQCIFIGTTNEMTGYLRDQTGNRRFWPVKTGTFRNDELKRDRDQLFAEAIDCYNGGEPWHFTDEDVIQMAMAEQSHRAEMDAWVECVESWLEREAKQGRAHSKLTTVQIASEVLNLSASQTDRLVTQRIANTMTALGWVKGQVRDGRSIRNGYKNPHYKDQLDDLIKGI